MLHFVTPCTWSACEIPDMAFPWCAMVLKANIAQVNASSRWGPYVITNECMRSKECPLTLYRPRTPGHGLDLFVVHTHEFASHVYPSHSDDSKGLQFVKGGPWGILRLSPDPMEHQSIHGAHQVQFARFPVQNHTNLWYRNCTVMHQIHVHQNCMCLHKTPPKRKAHL